MPMTKFGVVYSTGNAIILRYIYPSIDDAELNRIVLGAGEAMVQVSRGPYPSTAAWQTAVNNAVTTAAGKSPGNPRCAVVNSTTRLVTGFIMADAALFSLLGSMIVQTQANVPIGSSYDPVGKTFTIPAIPSSTNIRGEISPAQPAVTVPQ